MSTGASSDLGTLQEASRIAPVSSRSPLYEAQNAARYERQALIREYQRDNDCRLVVVSDMIFPHSITLFEETLFDAEPQSPAPNWLSG